MKEIGQPFYRTLYQATIDTKSLADGIREIKVRSTSPEEIRSRSFVVANDRSEQRYSADAVLSFTVANPTDWTTARAPRGKAEVLINGTVVGELEQGKQKAYAFPVASKQLRKVNLLSFRFSQVDDGITLTSPSLTHRDLTYRDPRDEAIRQIKAAHWGEAAVDWGGYIAGNAQPPDETPFDRRQNVFCFILNENK
jgi:hypothetical protein